MNELLNIYAVSGVKNHPFLGTQQMLIENVNFLSCKI